MPISEGQEVSRIAVEVPAAVSVLEKHGIRFYDSTPESLAAACGRAGISPEMVLGELEAASRDASEENRRWDGVPLPALVRYILDHHHAWERDQVKTILRRLEDLSGSPSGGIRGLRQLQDLFGTMSKGFLQHMKVEEADLFPEFIREVAPGAGAVQRGRKARKLLPLVQKLVGEHDSLLTRWDAMRALAGLSRVPKGASEGQGRLWGDLRELEAYQHQHIHKENFILFEKIRSMAQD